MRALAATALAASLLCLAGCEQHFTKLDAEAASPSPAADAVPLAAVPVTPNAPPSAPSLDEPGNPRGSSDGKLHVWFMDVGQGDAVLLRTPSGRTVLVDGGPPEASSHLSRRLPELANGPIDLAIITHPHPDHFGALAQALQVVGVKRVMAPRPLPSDPVEYQQLIAFLESRGTPVFTPAPPQDAPGSPLTIRLDQDAALSLYWPRAPTEALLKAADPVDANSLVMRVTFKDVSLFLAGDATRETESYLLAKRWPFRSTLLKVGAHGDDAASSEAFLKAVHPEAAIISVGAGNQRGSPSRAAVDRLRASGADVYRTDLDGEVRADSDGRAFVLITERPAAGEEPDTPHVYGDKDGDERATFAQSVADDVRKSRTRQRPAEERYGKVIEVNASTEVRRPPRGAGAGASQAPSSADRFVASKNSKVFHLPDCPAAKRIKDKNLVIFRSRAEAQSAGRTPAGDCHP